MGTCCSGFKVGCASSAGCVLLLNDGEELDEMLHDEGRLLVVCQRSFWKRQRVGHVWL